MSCDRISWEDDPEFAELMATSDEELLRKVAERGGDIPALVRAVKVQIAESLSEATRPPPREAGRPPLAHTDALSSWFRGQARARPAAQHIPLRIALDDAIADLDLEPVSYLMVLVHRWTLGQAAEAAQEYRCWLQSGRDRPDEVILPSAEAHLFWQCHMMTRRYQEQMQEIFAGGLPCALCGASVKPPAASVQPQRPPTPGQADWRRRTRGRRR
jgi:hypothetical protein